MGPTGVSGEKGLVQAGQWDLQESVGERVGGGRPMGSTGIIGEKGWVGTGQWGLQECVEGRGWCGQGNGVYNYQSVPMGSQKSVESWWCLQI